MLLALAASNTIGLEAQAPDLGFPRHSPELRARLARALAAREPGFDPRSQHRLADGSPRFTNRLLLEGSPYLRQHAHNPVDWYAWGPEALATAAREDKPIFLSIGYSTCHWCHVMERESFDDLGIAALLGESFIAIKVDREERPDLDDIYMTAFQLTGQSGGWPLQSFLTPAGSPFFASTYLPPERFGEVLREVARIWREKRPEIEVTAASLADAVREVAAARAEAVEIGSAAVARAIKELVDLEDTEHGGLGGAPKFPHEAELLFLLDQAALGQPEAARVAERALDAMARGGIFDQIGGGFHRYATDAGWRVPHFEKMLYNQALLARAYVAGYRLTGRASFRRAAAQTLDYVLREMTSSEGGFYSATDADSEGVEGRFFVWSPAELEQALGAADAAWAAKVLGVTPEGNFEGGHTVLHLPLALDAVARANGASLEVTLARLDGVRVRLRAARGERPPPLRDEKVLVAWNGMMIVALAEGYATLGDERWLAAAERAADLLWTQARRGPGRWLRVRLDGNGSVAALLEDHAGVAEAMLTLYDVTGDRRFLTRATETLDGMVERFWDAEGGGFFLGAVVDGEALIARPKSPQDGAVPSGNAVALRALAMAFHRTGEARWRERADALVMAFSGLVERSPSSFPYLLFGRSELEAGSTGSRRYAARGNVAIRAVARSSAGGDDGPLRLSITLDLAPGWHVNSFAPLDPSLIATTVVLAADAGEWRLEDLAYPEPRKVRLGFQKDPLSVYSGRVELQARLLPPAQGAAGMVPVMLRLQACDDRSCLRPEDVSLRVAVAHMMRPPTAPF